jgi:uncharacterized protein YmfQ (DUF2313 family)
VIRTIDEQTDSLAAYLPDGELWRAKWIDGSVTRLWLRGLAEWQRRVNTDLDAYRLNLIPDEVIPEIPELYMAEWERALGIPDGCFTGAGSVEKRMRDVRIKLSSLGVQTAADFEALGAMFGRTVKVRGGISHMPISEGGYETELPTLPDPPLPLPASQDSFATVKEARFTIVVTETLPTSQRFPYPFPIVFASADQATMQCLMTRLAPATTQVYFVQS